MGLAGSLLVFTGLWHALECLMGGRNQDTLRLIPVGLIYLLLGGLIVTFQGGAIVPWIALLATAIGMVAAFTQRHKLKVRSWVIWSFIAIDALIIVCLLSALVF